jgi:hypothetical protein
MRAELITLRADGTRRVALRILHLESELPSTSVPLNSATLNIAGSRVARCRLVQQRIMPRAAEQAPLSRNRVF